MRFTVRFMLQVGLDSSILDILTFAVLLVFFASPIKVFRIGWFIQPPLTELVIALVVRTHRPSCRCRPSRMLIWSSGAAPPSLSQSPTSPGSPSLALSTYRPPSLHSLSASLPAACSPPRPSKPAFIATPPTDLREPSAMVGCRPDGPKPNGPRDGHVSPSSYAVHTGLARRRPAGYGSTDGRTVPTTGAVAPCMLGFPAISHAH